MFQRFINKYRNYTVYKKDMDKFNKDKEIYITLNKDERFRVNELSPVLNDYRQNAGMIGGYFWQDLWGAKRVLADIKDGVKHYDIGSRVDGFIAHLLSGGGMRVCLIDVRPLDIDCPGLEFICADATKLDSIQSNSVYSLSALCSLEHFGLGRYNDPVDPDGCFKAFKEIQRIMAPKGRIYISVPVGQDRLLFNEERIFKAGTVIDSFPLMSLVEYSVMDERITENGGRKHSFDWNCEITKYDDYSGKMKTGFFVFEKK